MYEHPVELGGLTPIPQLVQLHFGAVRCPALEGLGYHRQGATGAGKACIFREGPELDGTVPAPPRFRRWSGGMAGSVMKAS